MRTLKPILILLFLVSFMDDSLGQKSSITGVLKADSTGLTLFGANVYLEKAIDSSFVNHSITDESGKFEIIANPGNYLITHSYIGYENKTELIELTSEDLDLGSIYLMPGRNSIQSVLIEADENTIFLEGDTTSFNADHYLSNPDATAGDLIEKMPGMQKKDGKTHAEGEEVQRVLVDGREFFGDDPKAALANIPAEIIDKIQVYDQQSEQSQFTGFDDGNTVKTINIVTKEKFRNGWFGRVSGAYGEENRYLASGSMNYFNNEQRITLLGQSNNINQQNFSSEDLVGIVSQNQNNKKGGRRGGRGNGGSNASDFLVADAGGITNTNAFGINYSDEFGKKWKMSASYFLNQTENNNSTDLIQDYFVVNNLDQFYEENENSELNNFNHRLNLRLEFKMNDQNTFKLRPSLTFQDGSNSNNYNSSTFINDTLSNLSNNVSSSNNEGLSFRNFLMWQHKFKKKGRTFSTFSIQNFSNQNNLRYLNNETNFLEDDVIDSLLQQSFDDQFELDLSAKFVYTEPISDNSQLMLSYRPGYNSGVSDTRTFVPQFADDAFNILDSTLSNELESEFISHEIGTGFKWSKDRKHRLNLSVNYQFSELQISNIFPTESQRKSNYQAVLPSLNYRYSLKKEKSFSFSYRPRTNIPRIDDLQEILDNSNATQLSIGNADLDQSYDHRFRAKYSRTSKNKGSIFILSLRGNYMNDYVATQTIQSNRESLDFEGISIAPGSQLTRPINLDGQYGLSLFSTYGFPIKKIKSNLNINLEFAHSSIPGILNSRDIITNNQLAGLGFILSSTISKKLDFTMGSQSNLNFSETNVQGSDAQSFGSQESNAKIYWNFWKKFNVRAQYTNLYYGATENSADELIHLLNASVGMKFLKDENAEINISVFDLLNQNTSISRITTDTYIQESETLVLNRYIMFNFNYKIRAFKSKS